MFFCCCCIYTLTCNFAPKICVVLFSCVRSPTLSVILCSFPDREGLGDAVDKEVAHPDNSLSDGTILTSSSDEEDEEDDEDDSSSLSSKGEGERPEESLVRCLTFCRICLFRHSLVMSAVASDLKLVLHPSKQKQSGQQKKSKIQHIATEIMSSESV